jgi:DNA polymerase zeta
MALPRSTCTGHASVKERQEDEYGQLHASGLHAAGRIILNLWRLLRGEVGLSCKESSSL